MFAVNLQRAILMNKLAKIASLVLPEAFEDNLLILTQCTQLQKCKSKQVTSSVTKRKKKSG